jgi:hypothetical protein
MLNMVSNVGVGRLASWRCSLVFQNRAISLPEVFLGLVRCSGSASRRYVSRREASRCSVSVFQHSALLLPWAHVRKNGILIRCRVDTRRDARRRFSCVLWFLWGHESWVRFATTCVATLGIVLPASCLVASLCSSAFYKESWVRVATIGIDLPASCAFIKLMYAFVESFVGVSTLGFGLWVSCRIVWCRRASRGSSAIHIYGIFCRRRDDRRRHARRRFVSVASCGIPMLICAKDGILCRRRNAYRQGSRLRFVCTMSYVIQRVTYRWMLSKNLSLNPKSSPSLESRTVFGFVPLVPVISSPKRTNFAFAPFFSCA